MWRLSIIFLGGIAALPHHFEDDVVLNATEWESMNHPDVDRAFLRIGRIHANGNEIEPMDHQSTHLSFVDEFEPRDFHETNPLLTPYGRLEEGDLLRSPEEDRKAMASGQIWNNRQYRYEITSGASRSAVEAGIQFWRDNTCITFEEVSSDSTEPRVLFVAETGCWSMLGCTAKYAGSRTQKLSLGSGCTGLGTVTHEIGHSLGFYHEQSRADRDDHVAIIWDNIINEYVRNFEKAKTEHHGVPYDLSSVMHYGTTFFTSNGKPTIVTLDPTMQGLIGQRERPSFRDVALMNRLYRCEELCSSPPSCQNGGYVTANCVCHCPPGTAGSACETAIGSYYPQPTCGGLVTSEGALASPGWPALYPPSADCSWWIKPPAGRRARVTFSDFSIMQEVNGSCKYEHLWVRLDGVLDGGEQYCHKQLDGRQLTATSPDGDMALQFRAYKKFFMGSGFYAQVEFV